MEVPGEHTPFPPLVDMPLYLIHEAANATLVNNSRLTCGRWSDSHRQLFSRLKDGWTRLRCCSSLHSPIKGLTGLRTSQSQFHNTGFSDHRVLRISAENRQTRARKKHTLIAAMRELAEEKASLVIFRVALSLARSRASTAAFNEGRAVSGFFGCRNVVFIVKRRGDGVEVVGVEA